MAELKQQIETITSHTDGTGKSVSAESSTFIRFLIAAFCLIFFVCVPNCADAQIRFGEEPKTLPNKNGTSLQLANEHSFLRTTAEAAGANQFFRLGNSFRERQGASRRFIRIEPAASAVPLTSQIEKHIYPVEGLPSLPEDIPVGKKIELKHSKPIPVKKTSDSWLGFVSNSLPTRKPATDSRDPARKIFRDGKPNDDKTNKRKPVQGRDPIDLQKTLKKVGTATFLVLAGCCAFLLIARKLGFGQGQDVKTSKAASKSSIKILETRRLAGRCQLKLIEVDDCRFLVAVDGGGVKSVQSVAKSFSDSLNEYEENDTETVDATSEKHTEVDTARMNQVSASKNGSQVGERLTSLIQRI